MNYRKIVGTLPDDLRRSIELLRYGVTGVPEREKQIDRLYEPYSITLACLEGEETLGTVRIIMKRNSFEKLPCEFAYIVQHLNEYAPMVPAPDGAIEIPATPDLMPVVEVGGLCVSNRIPVRLRGVLVAHLMNSAYQESLAIKAKVAFISCELSPVLERLYTRNYQFEESAIITYHTGTNYKLFYKWNTSLIPEQHTLRAQKGETYSG